MCEQFHITQRSCAVVYDGKGAIDKVFSASSMLVKPSWKQADLTSACVKLIEKIPIQLIPLHVKGHQDTGQDFQDLSIFEQLNVLMDAKAKIAMSNFTYSSEEVT